MKILLDPISTNDPSMCSCHYKMKTMVEYLLQRRDDLFFYYLVPDTEKSGENWDVDYNWLPKSDRIKYVPVSAHQDRMKEYARVPTDIEDAIAYNGPLWDYDVLFTARSTQVPTYRMWMTRANRFWTKSLIIDDEFPIMSFKARVNQPHPECADLQAINAYLAADRTFILSFITREQILSKAKEFLSPSRVRDLSSKIISASSIQVKEVVTKSASDVAKTHNHEKPLTVAFTMRLKGKVEFVDPVIELMEKHFIYYGNQRKLRFLITSNSRQAENYRKYEYFEVMRTPREAFWKLMREEADVILSMSEDEDYPLSLIEPVLLGVPGIFLKAPYVTATFGKDYPFVAKNEAEAHGMLKQFYDDYGGMYEKFMVWSNEWFRPTMMARNDLWFPLMMDRELSAFEKSLSVRVKAPNTDEDGGIIPLILEYLDDRKRNEFVFEDVMLALADKGLVKHVAELLKKPRHKISYSLGAAWNDYRLKFKYGLGWKDASTKTGHFKV